MHFLTAVVGLTSLILLHSSVLAHPFSNAEGDLDIAPTPVEKRADCATIDQFTVESFAAASTLTPTSNTCLFYTQRTNGETTSLSETAKCYAKNNGLTTIWVWKHNTNMFSNGQSL